MNGLTWKIAILMFLMPLAALHAEELYRWVDENGVVHFSDTKPAHLDVQASALPEIPRSGGENPYQADSTSPDAASSEAQRRREELAEMREVNQQADEALRKQCESWRAEIARIEPNRRVFFVNEAGETERMDDEERVNRVAQLKDMVSANCNGIQ